MTGLREKTVSVAILCALAGCVVSPKAGNDSLPAYGVKRFPLPLPENTRAALAANGLALMPPARKLACRHTARQSIPETVVDLGNPLVSDLCAVCVQTWAEPSELARHHRHMFNVQVLRLIEAGREDPGTVSRLLHETINRSLADFERAREACLEARRKGYLPNGVEWDDPYYRRHGKYEHPVVEFDRLQDAAYMSFYVLANIDELNEPGLLGRWLSRESPQYYSCVDMDLWLVDCYFRRHGKGTEGAERHVVLMNGVDVSGRPVSQSCWNAAWDIYDPLLTSKHIDTSGIQTIEVLEIPRKLPYSLDAQTKERIVANFIDFAREPKSGR